MGAVVKRCALLLLLLTGCTTETILEIGDGTREECRFYLRDDAPLLLTADMVRYCAGHFEVVLLGPVG